MYLRTGRVESRKELNSAWFCESKSDGQVGGEGPRVWLSSAPRLEMGVIVRRSFRPKDPFGGTRRVGPLGWGGGSKSTPDVPAVVPGPVPCLKDPKDSELREGVVK